MNDFLISEGNYNCIGKPDAFRAGGKAVVEIYVTSGADAFRGFYEVVRGYRILDTRPLGAGRSRAPLAMAVRIDRQSGLGEARDLLAQPGARPGIESRGVGSYGKLVGAQAGGISPSHSGELGLSSALAWCASAKCTM